MNFSLINARNPSTEDIYLLIKNILVRYLKISHINLSLLSSLFNY
jgi:hypothetical protein